MVEFKVNYEGPSAYQGGAGNMAKFASDLKSYMGRNTDEEEAIEKVKIEGRGPGSRLVRITFPCSGFITTQHVEIHDDHEEARLQKELILLYKESGFNILE